MATVSVKGTAQASVRPDRAMLSVQVSEVELAAEVHVRFALLPVR